MCNQQYDSPATESRLRVLVERADLSVDIPEELHFAQAADTLRDLESRLVSQRARLHASESVFSRLGELYAHLELSAEALGLTIPGGIRELPNSLHELESEAHTRSTQLRTLREKGRRLSASLARAVEATEAAQLHQKVAELNHSIAEEESESLCVTRRMRMHERCNLPCELARSHSLRTN